MNPPVPTNRWSVSPTNTATIPPLQRLIIISLIFLNLEFIRICLIFN